MKIFVVSANDFPMIAFESKDKAEMFARNQQEVEDKLMEAGPNRYKIYYHITGIELMAIGDDGVINVSGIHAEIV